MKRAIVLIFSILVILLPLHANDTIIHQISVGPRGGIASFGAHGDLGRTYGIHTAIDFNYALLAKQFESKLYMGFRLGASLGYIQRKAKSSATSSFTIMDAYSYHLDYSISTTSIEDLGRQLRLSIPITASLRYRKFVMDAGLQFGIPIWSYYTMQVAKPDVNVYYRELDVTVSNALITGRVDDSQCKQQGTWKANDYTIGVCASIGYEWSAPSGHGVAITAYMDASLYSSAQDVNNERWFNVQSISANPSQPTKVEVNYPASRMACTQGYFDIGLKLAYIFNITKGK